MSAPRHAGGVRLTRRYDAPRSDVWTALTDPASIARWLGVGAHVKLRAGGLFEVRFRDGSAMAGSIRALDRERLLELEWRYPGEPSSVVRFELHDDVAGVRLVVDHRGLDREVQAAYGHGWTHHLHSLGAVLAPAGSERSS
ncbi:MAG: SRPBCC domain-containing protein [Actinomycetota bacterium]|nr:SRPBCC domain-containing protein [Actinomycetota bacterium]